MSTETATDIAALVGEMEAPRCEQQQHGIPGFAHDDGPATHYTRGHCNECGYVGTVKPACATYIAHAVRNGRMKCGQCGARGVASDFMTILGPVSK